MESGSYNSPADEAVEIILPRISLQDQRDDNIRKTRRTKIWIELDGIFILTYSAKMVFIVNFRYSSIQDGMGEDYSNHKNYPKIFGLCTHVLKANFTHCGKKFSSKKAIFHGRLPNNDHLSKVGVLQ